MDHMKFETPDRTAENIEKLAELFPSAITEIRGADGRLKKGVNFDVLRQLLSPDVADGGECYEFTWVGKRAAMAEAARPITETLRPVKSDSRDWDTTQNLYIEGDNLAALKLLQESYLGKVRMIYIDPPYNTGRDFLYRDSFQRGQQEENRQMGMYDEEENQLFKNTESNGRFHSDWCSMLFSRLLLARDLLMDSGAIFVSIDDNEAAAMSNMLDEVFGRDNRVAEFVVIRAEGGGLAKQVIKGHDYLYVYAKAIHAFTPLGKAKDIRGRLVERDGETYWVQEDWLRKEFGKYGNCHYEEIEVLKGPDKKREIDRGLKNGTYMLLPQKNGMHLVGKLRSVKEDASKFYSIIKHLSKQGIQDLAALGLAAYFDYPKPVSLVREMVSGATFFTKGQGDIILDFFSGSATTAQAVMELNAEDGGNRKFILVQLPEPCGEDSEAYRAGYRTICDIGRERIRRAGDKLKAAHPDANLDIGFRVFRVDESNMEDVYYHPEKLTQAMLDGMVSNIKAGRTDLDLLYACLLDWGMELHLPHTRQSIAGCTVHNVDRGALMACFDRNVPEAVVRAMAAERPRRAVFRDSAFASDDAKINVTEIFKTLSPDTKVKVI